MERLEDSFIPNLRPLFKAVISPFNNTIVIANKMNAKPYRKGYKTPKIPQYIKDKIDAEYYWNEKGRLVDLKGNIVPSNKNKVGQPRIWQANYQDIYNDKLDKNTRNNYITKLEDYIRPFIEENEFLDTENMAVHLHFYIIDKTKNETRDNKLIDEDNMVSIWQKCVRDVMKGLIIPDDNQKYIRGSKNDIDYVLTEEETRLEITIWKRH